MKLFDTLYRRLSGRRRFIAYAIYGLTGALAYTVGYLLRFEFAIPPAQARVLLITVGGVAAVRVLFARLFRLTAGRWRFVSTPDVVRLFLATSAGSLFLLLLREVLLPTLAVPRSVLLIEWVLSTYGTAGIWIAYRVGFERMRQARGTDARHPAKRALIVGAGEAGNLLAREILRYPTGYRLIGFVDDDRAKMGLRIQGVDVLGSTEELSAIAEVVGADEIILAIPSAEPAELRRLVQQCEEMHVPFKVLPGIREVLAGQVGVAHLRELRIEDLLGREPIQLELPELADDLMGRCVLITGAAGSIGSELARQVALHGPGKLVLLDQAETDLFYLDLELRERHADLDIVPVVADVVDEPHMNRIFRHHAPHRVFHAAAYKHVPLMETNVEQAVKNNVVGTAVVAEAAGRHGTGMFVLVSTDKAVTPANVMGSTKRMAELVVLDFQERYPCTAFGAVRFGNVLGSRGSVIPIFRRQLRDGKPLTVTHPDATRYFMTIPEAVQLILQASLLPELRGHIAMLDMGEPVKIVDLARNVLRLSGIEPRMGDTYRFTGLRAGEKMHEELVAPHEGTIETTIPKVRILRTFGDGLFDIPGTVRRWTEILGNGHAEDVETELRTLFVGLNGFNGHPPSDLEMLPAPPPAARWRG
ncbi:MAG TPA: nucleoside-diphosphate sugar epimerase/dehydratase [Longimicrobiales bacterium]|nr:nucleoside-diphosphate sugar epimerase/dehydratase [Longimicrobiales bacterium]